MTLGQLAAAVKGNFLGEKSWIGRTRRLRVLWKCWQTPMPYQKSRHLQQLLQRKIPNAAMV
jgi:hypothetical protein